MAVAVVRDKLLHIHVPKTGGSWLGHQLEKHFPHRYLGQKTWHVKLSSYQDNLPRPGGHEAVSSHIAYSTRQGFDETYNGDLPIVSNSTIVSICRNPFDYLVSFYHHHDPVRSSYGAPSGCNDINTIHGIRSFEEFIKKFCDPGFPFAKEFNEMRSFLFHQMFNDHGRCGVDIIFKNEQLYSSCERFISFAKGVPVELNKQRINTSKLREKKDYRSYYTDELRDLVRIKCGAELMLFGYDFDGPTSDDAFVDSKKLFYHPMYPVAGYDIPDEVVNEHQRLLAIRHNRAQLRQVRHILPDIFVFQGEEGHLCIQNPGDPKILMTACDNVLGEPPRCFVLEDNPFNQQGRLWKGLFS